ncbi:pyroglutamyl-peptidase I [Polaromonas sp. YR568]|uniref:pyroglutamyl-peptidase I n=1 Tax=Polaromonas sp. YR568 TaxID=1855301 RepID=UPI00398BECA9
MPTATPLPRVLLTGFDPFGDTGHSSLPLNPSWMAVKALRSKRIGGHLVVAAQLPTVFQDSIAQLVRLLALHKPALVICVGQAGGRGAISLERVAINVNDARIPDNLGGQPVDTPVVADGPAAYFSSLPIKAMLQALQEAGVAAEVSQTAGTFVCNHVFYALMHALATRRGLKRTRGGFVHVPYLPEQGAPSLPLEEIVRGLRLAVAAALATKHDITKGAGAVS